VYLHRSLLFSKLCITDSYLVVGSSFFQGKLVK